MAAKIRERERSNERASTRDSEAAHSKRESHTHGFLGMCNFATGHYSMSIFADQRYFDWSLLLDTIQIVIFATRHYVYYNNNFSYRDGR